MKYRQNGFTLIELMIVISIIGILAAIAIPQFSTYRIRANNTKAVSAVGVIANCEAALNKDLLIYGGTAKGVTLQNAVGVVNGGAILSGAVNAIVAATNTVPGAHVTGIRADNAISAVGFSVPFGVEVLATTAADTSGNQNGCYLILSEAVKGNRAFGMDSDLENTIYFVQNSNWPGSIGLDSIPPALNSQSVDNFNGQPGGGAPNPNWTQLN